MRTIESKTYEVDGAKLKLLLVENGKVLPFRVMCHHKPPKGGMKMGTLAAVASEDEGREQLEFHQQEAEKQGWSPAVRVRLISIPPPPSGVPTSAESGAPPKRKLGRPRKA